MFRSFFLAGFESATGVNAHGQWIDQVAATHHDLHVYDDYRRLAKVGIRAAREAIRWPIVDRCGRYDFKTIDPFLQASRKLGIDIIWDLFHYGYPPDLDLFGDEFPERFAAYCAAAARYICQHSRGACWFTPVNEPSFFAWAGGEAGQFAPHQKNRGRELKIALARAAIQGINAIRAVAPHARIVNVDPICHVVPAPGRPEDVAYAERFNNTYVYESWDMLCGRLMPELGGTREHLDIVGVNYYWTNQWELGHEREPLAQDDPRLVPLRTLLRSVWERYGGELIVTETSHVHDLRPSWLDYAATEVESLILDGVPIRGVCLYPILGMPEWHTPHEWVRMGLWDLEWKESKLHRKLCIPMFHALRRAQDAYARALQSATAVQAA